MKFKILRLGQSAYFDGHQRDNISSKEYEIESCDSPAGFVLKHKELYVKNKERHFISIYNVAYAQILEEESGENTQRETETSTRTEISNSKKSAKPIRSK
jgi:hypothetical protein